MRTTLFFCCIVLLGTLGFGHGVGVTISKREAQSGASKSTLLENLKNGKVVREEPLTDELEAKGAKKMANNLKEGKPVRWEIHKKKPIQNGKNKKHPYALTIHVCKFSSIFICNEKVQDSNSKYTCEDK